MNFVCQRTVHCDGGSLRLTDSLRYLAKEIEIRYQCAVIETKTDNCNLFLCLISVSVSNQYLSTAYSDVNINTATIQGNPHLASCIDGHGAELEL